MKNLMSVFNKKNIEKIASEANNLVEEQFNSLSDDKKKEYCKLGCTFLILMQQLGYKK